MGGNVKCVEPVQALRGNLFRMELASWVVKLQRDGVLVGNPLLPVFQDESYVKRISRSPDPSFAIDEPFQSLLYLFSAYIEAADGLLFAVCHADVGFLLVHFGNDNEGHAFRGDFNKAFPVGLARSDGLQLEVVGGYFCLLYRPRVQDVAYGNP